MVDYELVYLLHWILFPFSVSKIEQFMNQDDFRFVLNIYTVIFYEEYAWKCMVCTYVNEFVGGYYGFLIVSRPYTFVYKQN